MILAKYDGDGVNDPGHDDDSNGDNNNNND